MVKINSKFIGISWMLMHCFSTSCISAITKKLITHYNVFQIMFVQNMISAVLLIFLLSLRSYPIQTQKLRLHFTRALTNFIGLALYYYSLKLIPLTEVRAISMTSPIIKSILAMIFLREAIYFNRIVGLIIGAIGASIVIFKPNSFNFLFYNSGFDNNLLYIISAVLVWAFSSILIKVINKSDSNMTQLFFFLFFSTVISAPNAIFYWKEIIQNDWLLFIISGVLYFINTSFTLEAYKYADLTVLMPFNFSTIIFSTILAYSFFDEKIHAHVIIGSAIILFGGVYLAYKEKNFSLSNRQKKQS